MLHPNSGPRRSESVDAYLRGTRVLAAIALLALVGGVVWDVLAGRFWARHALLAGLAASVIVVMLTVALVNEAVERRSRQRWSVLAQYVMLQLVRDARLVWTGFAELAGLMPSDPYATEGDVLTATSRSTRARARSATQTASPRRCASSSPTGTSASGFTTRSRRFMEHNDAVLGRWAP